TGRLARGPENHDEQLVTYYAYPWRRPGGCFRVQPRRPGTYSPQEGDRLARYANPDLLVFEFRVSPQGRLDSLLNVHRLRPWGKPNVVNDPQDTVQVAHSIRGGGLLELPENLPREPDPTSINGDLDAVPWN